MALVPTLIDDVQGLHELRDRVGRPGGGGPATLLRARVDAGLVAPRARTRARGCAWSRCTTAPTWWPWRPTSSSPAPAGRRGTGCWRPAPPTGSSPSPGPAPSARRPAPSRAALAGADPRPALLSFETVDRARGLERPAGRGLARRQAPGAAAGPDRARAHRRASRPRATRPGCRARAATSAARPAACAAAWRAQEAHFRVWPGRRRSWSGAWPTSRACTTRAGRTAAARWR